MVYFIICSISKINCKNLYASKKHMCLPTLRNIFTLCHTFICVYLNSHKVQYIIYAWNPSKNSLFTNALSLNISFPYKNFYQYWFLQNTHQILSPITKCTELKVAICLELQKIIEALTMPGKGVLACDESPSSLDSRFANINLENTENARRDYREMLLSAGKVATSIKIINYNVDIAIDLKCSFNYNSIWTIAHSN